MQQTLGDLFSVPEGGSIFTYFYLFAQIAAHERLQQLVAVEAADEAAGVVVVGDIRRILGENVADELVDGVVPFDNKGMIHGSEDLLHFCFVVDRVKPSGCVFHVKPSLIQVLVPIIPKNTSL